MKNRGESIVQTVMQMLLIAATFYYLGTISAANKQDETAMWDCSQADGEAVIGLLSACVVSYNDTDRCYDTVVANTCRRLYSE